MYEYDETFDRPVFTEKCYECELTRGGKTYKKDGGGIPKYFEKACNKERPKMQWLKDHRLTSDSHPLDWFMTLMEKCRRRASNPRRSVFEDWNL